MDTTQRAGQAANCPLCGELPDELIVRTGRDESFPAAFNKLVLAGGDDFTSWGDSSQDYRCPNCGAKFVCENHTSFTGSGINDESRIIRVPPKAPARQQVNSPSDAHAAAKRAAAAAAAAAKRAAEVEAAQARHAFSIMEKHFASAGAVMKYPDPPKDWSGFCGSFYLNTIEFVQRGSHTRLLAKLLAELVDYMQAFSGSNFTNNLYRLLIDFHHYSWLEPLLPDSARGRMDAMEEMRLEGEEEAERLRLGQMSY